MAIVTEYLRSGRGYLNEVGFAIRWSLIGPLLSSRNEDAAHIQSNHRVAYCVK